HDWTIFIIFVTIHLLANYMAVGSLVFRNLNNARLLLLIKMYLKFDTVISPVNINKRESLILGFGMKSENICGYKIKMGCSLRKALNLIKADELMNILTTSKGKNYIIVPNFKNKSLYVSLRHNETPHDVISAYFHAVMTGIALSKYNNQPTDFQMKRHLHQVTPLIRLDTLIKHFPKNNSDHLQNLTQTAMENFNEYINFELSNFFTALRVNGWSISTHGIEMGSWRYIRDEGSSIDTDKKHQ
ncbi:hypothetical protein AMK59_8573, partial [Oryctes borbonicus]